MSAETCGRCRFFHTPPADGEPGLCRRYPPAVLIERLDRQVAVSTEFPRVGAPGWCGEWKPIGTIQ